MTRRQNQKIMQLAKSIQNLARKAVTAYGREVDEILYLGCREKQLIERALDGMLGFCFDKSMLALYKKLCRYYCTIDRNAAAEYMLIYREMWEIEDA